MTDPEERHLGGRGSGYDAIFERIATRLATTESVSLARLSGAAGPQGYGPILILMSLIVISPVGLIPLLPSAIGVLLALTGLAMLFGSEGLPLPGRVARIEVETARVIAGLGTVRRLTSWLRPLLRPRLARLAEGRLTVMLCGAIVLGAGAALTVLGVLPIPGLPFIVALPLLFMGLGLAARDGIVVAVSLAGTLGASGFSLRLLGIV